VSTTLTRLTCLETDGIYDPDNIAHMARLKDLRVNQGRVGGLDDDYVPGGFPGDYVLGGLTALESLDLCWGHDYPHPGSDSDSSDDSDPIGPLPHLCSLELDGCPERITKRMHTLGAPQLTTLKIGGCPWPHVAAMGVLPQLQQLHLSEPSACLDAAWLQQQPRLTRLCLSYGGRQAQQALLTSWLGALPLQLVELDLSGSTLAAEGSVLQEWAVLGRLSNLRSLGLAHVKRDGDPSATCDGDPFFGERVERQLPPWLLSLVCLEVLHVGGWVAKGGWEVLAHLPRLRRVVLAEEVEMAALQHVPHLCWQK
jgi:hypothetical protein